VGRAIDCRTISPLVERSFDCTATYEFHLEKFGGDCFVLMLVLSGRLVYILATMGD